MKSTLLLSAALLAVIQPAFAESGTETAGTAVAIALPLTAAGIAFFKKDWNGVVDLGLTGLATVGTAYALKQIVKEKRPDGSDYQSFPSDTTALAATGSSFLWARYGWQYGLPATAATAFVAFSRVDARQHHWYDTAASEAISIGFATLITPRFNKYNIRASLDPAPGGAALRLSYNY